MIFLKRLIVGSLFLLLLFLVLSLVNHRIKMRAEIRDTSIVGQMVNVNGHLMHVYTQGEGEDTLVFMAGSGTSSPTLDFKSLWSRLADDYKIAVVEKAGYGFSEVTKGLPRDIDSILAETRLALEKAGQKPPFVLVPHSISAVEAIYWANKYPDEVKAIIGIDPVIPSAYTFIPTPPLFLLRGMSFLASIGVTRFIPLAENFLSTQGGYYSEEEQNIYRELQNRRLLTTNMVEEVKAATSNATMVESLGVPAQIPMYFFASNGKAVGVENWQDLLEDYTKKLEHGNYLALDAGHYLHHHEPVLMTEHIKEFISSLR